MTRIALVAGGIALLAGWYALHERDKRRDAEAALRGAERVVESLNDYAYQITGIENALRDGLEGLNDFPDTSDCGPVVHGALDRLRAE